MSESTFWKRYGNGAGPTVTLSLGEKNRSYLITLENFGKLSGVSVIEDRDHAEHSYSGWVRMAQRMMYGKSD